MYVLCTDVHIIYILPINCAAPQTNSLNTWREQEYLTHIISKLMVILCPNSAWYMHIFITSTAWYYNDVIMGAMASQITSLTIVYSTVYSGTDQRKHESSPSLAFVRGIHQWPVNSPNKWPVTRKMFPFDDVIMICEDRASLCHPTGNCGIQLLIPAWGYCFWHQRRHIFRAPADIGRLQ